MENVWDMLGYGEADKEKLYQNKKAGIFCFEDCGFFYFSYYGSSKMNQGSLFPAAA